MAGQWDRWRATQRASRHVSLTAQRASVGITQETLDELAAIEQAVIQETTQQAGDAMANWLVDFHQACDTIGILIAMEPDGQCLLTTTDKEGRGVSIRMDPSTLWEHNSTHDPGGVAYVLAARFRGVPAFIQHRGAM